MKFFLFNITESNIASVRASDSGEGISTFCVPVHKLSNITSSKGFIHMTFDDAGIYEEIFMKSGDAIEKVNISVATEEGAERALTESILTFINNTSNRLVLRFDAVTDLPKPFGSRINSSSDIKIKIPTLPISIETGRFSVGTDAEEFQDTIAGINFRGNLPSLDFNHEGLSSFADGAEITSWANAGTGGFTYNIASNVGTPSCETDAATSGISTRSLTITGGEYLIIPNSFTVKYDYTIYFVIGSAVRPLLLYGDSAGETIGFGGGKISGAVADANSVKSKRYSFTVRHSGITGVPATTQTDDTNNGTIDYRWPDYQESETDVSKMEGVDVFIVRRDVDFNMYLHNRDGDIIGFIPAKTKSLDKTLLSTSSGRTDGDLLIQELGAAGNISGITGHFKGHVSRFGVIPNDIGIARSSRLAQDLFKFYNP